MNWTGLKRIAWTVAILMAVTTFVAPPSADAQGFRIRGRGEEGEPTDPDGALATLLATTGDLDLGDYGLEASAPVDDESLFIEWWNAVVNLLVSLGLAEVVEGDAD